MSFEPGGGPVRKGQEDVAVGARGAACITLAYIRGGYHPWGRLLVALYVPQLQQTAQTDKSGWGRWGQWYHVLFLIFNVLKPTGRLAGR